MMVGDWRLVVVVAAVFVGTVAGLRFCVTGAPVAVALVTFVVFHRCDAEASFHARIQLMAVVSADVCCGCHRAVPTIVTCHHHHRHVCAFIASVC